MATVNRAVDYVREGFRGLIVLALLAILAATLFVPTQEGSGEVQAGLLALLGAAARDYFAFRSEADKLNAEADAMRPSIG